MIKFDECGKFEFERNFVHMRRTMRFNELILMRKGTMYLAEEDELLVVNEGDVVFLKAGRLHYGYKPSEGNVEFYWMHYLTDDDTEASFPLIAPWCQKRDYGQKIPTFVTCHRCMQMDRGAFFRKHYGVLYCRAFWLQQRLYFISC